MLLKKNENQADRVSPASQDPLTPEQSVKIQEYAIASLSEGTQRNYHNALKRYQAENYALPATPEDIAHYIDNAETVKPDGDGGLVTTGKHLSISTLNIRIAALSHYHRQHHQSDPTDHPLVRAAMAAARKTRVVKINKARAITWQELTCLINVIRNENLDKPLVSKRDSAITLIAFFGSMRISEVISTLRTEHLDFKADGLIIDLPKSKTDRGLGAYIPIPSRIDNYCPVDAVKQWIKAADIETGPLFRKISRHQTIEAHALTSTAFNRPLKSYVQSAGLPDDIKTHSFRAGSATELFTNGVPLAEVSKHLRHRDPKTTMGYLRVSTEKTLEDAPTKTIGLIPWYRQYWIRMKSALSRQKE